MNSGSGVVTIGIVGFVPAGVTFLRGGEVVEAPTAFPDYIASYVMEITEMMGGTVLPMRIGNSDLADLSTPSSVPRTVADREEADLASLFGDAHDVYSTAAGAESSIKLEDMLAIIGRTQTSQLLQQTKNLAEDALVALLPEDAARALCALVGRTAEINIADRVQAIWQIIDASSGGNILGNEELIRELSGTISGLELFYGLGLGIHLAEKLAGAGKTQMARSIYYQAISRVANISDEEVLHRITRRAMLAASLFKFDSNAGHRLLNNMRRDGAILVQRIRSLAFEDLMVVIERLGNAIGSIGGASIQSELARFLRIAVQRIAKLPLPSEQDDMERLSAALESAAPCLPGKGGDAILKTIIKKMIAAARKIGDPERRATQLALAAATAIDHDFLDNAEDAIVEARSLAVTIQEASNRTDALTFIASISIRLGIANLTEQILRDALSSLAQMASDTREIEVLRIRRIISHSLLPADVQAGLLGILDSPG